MPVVDKLYVQIGRAVMAHSELSEEALGLSEPPDEIREVRLTRTLRDLIRCMWHGHREKGHASPPPIPLKIYVFAYGQSAGTSGASIEVRPGADRWEAE